ncbi:MAG: UbiA family prenyltransferase, partial [Candidatus Yanofskybacteria bacterium]|nr:UbiA family prenyltransferase [Candidatus Yanofskybacteria bacterium]
MLPPLLRLVRIENSLLVSIAIIAGQIMSIGKIPDLFFILFSIIPPFLETMGAFAANDYFDIETDGTLNRTDRPLVSGEFSKAFAIKFAILCYAIAIVSSWFVNSLAFITIVVFALISFSYSFKVKRVQVIGSIFVASAMAVPFIYGSFSLNVWPPASVIVATIILLILGIAREFVLTTRDIRGDKAAGIKTLPMIIGPRKTLWVAAILFWIGMALTLYPFLKLEKFYYKLRYWCRWCFSCFI